MPTPEQVKDATTVLSHVQLRAAQTGGVVGLLVAVPGMILAPMKFNRADDPPLIAAASIAGMGAVATSALVVPMTMALLLKDGSSKRAHLLRENRVQHQVDRLAAGGAVVGLSLQAVRMRTVAQSEGRSMWSDVNTKETMWEIFAMTVAGMAVSTVVGVASKKVFDKVKGMMGYDGGEAEEMHELDDGGENDIADLLQGSANADVGSTDAGPPVQPPVAPMHELDDGGESDIADLLQGSVNADVGSTDAGPPVQPPVAPPVVEEAKDRNESL